MEYIACMFQTHLHIRNELGIFGEETACNLLVQKGYKILERNLKVGDKEIDVVAENKTYIVFVEVKTRSNDCVRKPEEYVDAEKQRNMAFAANAYIKLNHVEKTPRFDIIGILADCKSHEIKELTHIEDAFYPPMRTVNRNTFSGQSRWKTKVARRR